MQRLPGPSRHGILMRHLQTIYSRTWLQKKGEWRISNSSGACRGAACLVFLAADTLTLQTPEHSMPVSPFPFPGSKTTALYKRCQHDYTDRFDVKKTDQGAMSHAFEDDWLLKMVNACSEPA